MIGQSILKVIPDELQHEEAEILAKLRAGERIERYETIRMHKNGDRLEISLTISPVRDSRGIIVGAAKIAHDITARRRAEQQSQGGSPRRSRPSIAWARRWPPNWSWSASCKSSRTPRRRSRAPLSARFSTTSTRARQGVVLALHAIGRAARGVLEIPHARATRGLRADIPRRRRGALGRHPQGSALRKE